MSDAIRRREIMLMFPIITFYVKERERQRELFRLYNGTDADDPVSVVQDDLSSASAYTGIYKGAASSTITETPSRMENDEPPVDDALAKYLDRDYWERRRNNVEVSSVRKARDPVAIWALFRPISAATERLLRRPVTLVPASANTCRPPTFPLPRLRPLRTASSRRSTQRPTSPRT